MYDSGIGVAFLLTTCDQKTYGHLEAGAYAAMLRSIVLIKKLYKPYYAVIVKRQEEVNR